MKKAVLKLYEGFTGLKTGIVLLVAGLYFSLMVFCGGNIFHFLLFALVLAGYIILPGLFFAGLPWVKENVGNTGPFLPVLLGSGFFLVVYCFAMRLGILWLLHFLPPVLGVLWLIFAFRQGTFKRIPKRFTLQPHQWLLVLLFAALWLFYTFYGVVKNAHPMAVGDVLLNQDLLWNVGNANSFKLEFPPQDIRFVGVRLQYHYLTEMLTGALSIVSGIIPYDINAFYLQPFMLAALVACLYKLGRILWEKSLLKTMLFTYSLFLFGCASLWSILPNGWSIFGNQGTTHLVTNINGMTTAFIFLSIFCGLLVPAMRQKYKVHWLRYLLLLCALVMLIFAKGPVAAIVVCSLVITALIGLLQRRTTWRGVVFALVAGGLFAATYIVMFSSGANDSMPFSLHGTLDKFWFSGILARLWDTNLNLWRVAVPLGWLAQSFLMMPAAFPLFVRGLFHDIRYLPQMPQERMFATGVSIGGLLAFFWFNHPSLSQVYFMLAAMFFLYMLAVDNIDYLRWPKPGALAKGKTAARKVFIVFASCCIAVGIITHGFLYVHFLGSGGRQLARNLGLIDKYPYDAVVTADDEAAMVWMRQNTPSTALFATNRIHTGGRLDGISNLYSAFSGRQGYMEGFSYAKTNMGVSEAVIQERLAVNTALFDGATPPEEVLRLCRENNIDYLIFSSQFDGSEAQLSLCRLVYDSPTIRLYQVPQA